MAVPAHAGPFSSFEGNWTGAGVISVDNGSKERLRCKAHYDVGGGGMHDVAEPHVRKRQLQVQRRLEREGRGQLYLGQLVRDLARHQRARISGSITPTQISAQVNGLGFTARIGIAAREGRQSVTISPTGTDISNVSVTMSKH